MWRGDKTLLQDIVFVSDIARDIVFLERATMYSIYVDHYNDGCSDKIDFILSLGRYLPVFEFMHPDLNR